MLKTQRLPVPSSLSTLGSKNIQITSTTKLERKNYLLIIFPFGEDPVVRNPVWEWELPSPELQKKELSLTLHKFVNKNTSLDVYFG